MEGVSLFQRTHDGGADEVSGPSGPKMKEASSTFGGFSKSLDTFPSAFLAALLATFFALSGHVSMSWGHGGAGHPASCFHGVGSKLYPSSMPHLLAHFTREVEGSAN
jgi:hypothetical protein